MQHFFINSLLNCICLSWSFQLFNWRFPSRNKTECSQILRQKCILFVIWFYKMFRSSFQWARDLESNLINSRCVYQVIIFRFTGILHTNFTVLINKLDFPIFFFCIYNLVSAFLVKIIHSSHSTAVNNR